MRSIVALGFALGLAFAPTASQAMPFAAAPMAGESAFWQVAYGCGGGRTRGPYGHCRPRFTCPPGFHSGPHGFHCFRNRW